MKKFTDYLKETKMVSESYSNAEEAVMDFGYGLEELEDAIKNLKNPEKYIEKYYKTTTPKIIDLMAKLVDYFERMR